MVSIIVPAYNEASVLRRTLLPLVEAGYQVIVVDDGSTDDFRAAIYGLPVLLRHAVNLGQGAALQTGMDYALRHGAAIAVHFDADGQHPAHEIPRLIEPIECDEADVVLGSRFLRPADAAQVPRARRLALRVGILVSGLFTGVWLSDTHNGFRALSRRALGCIALRENGFAHASEILVQIRRHRLRWKEVPAGIRYSDYSRQKGQPLWNSVNIVIDLLLEKIFR